MNPFIRLWRHNPDWRVKAKRATLFSVLNKLFDVLPEILIGVAVDLVVKREESFIASLGFVTPESQLLFLGALTFIVWSSESFFEYLFSVEWRNLAQTVQGALRTEGARNALSHQLAWFESSHSGRFQTVLGEDVNQLERFLDGGINNIIQLVTSTVLVSAVFFYLSPAIAVLALLPIPFIFGGSMFFQKKLEPRYRRVREAAARIGVRLSTVFSGIMTVKSFSMEQVESEKLRRLSDAYAEENRNAIKVSSAFIPLIRILILMGFLVTLVYGGFLAFDGELDVGSYSVLVFLTQRLLWPFTRLGETVDLYQRAMASTDRIMELVHLKPESSVSSMDQNHKKPGSSTDNSENISLEFSGVSFSYPGSKGSVLSNISFRVESPGHIGIVGSTGSGKSTLVKLMLGFYGINKGSVSVWGKDISSYEAGELRKFFSYVPQDVFLFDGTFYENLVYGSNSATEERLNQVLVKTGLDNLVSSLEHGLETRVGERGVMLSGGQRQRIAIARALLKDAPVLILDEATSAVDNETEMLIKRTVDELSKSKLIFSVAHRLSTIRRADEILVFDGGCIVGRGTHDAMVSSEGVYKNLWDIQTGVK